LLGINNDNDWIRQALQKLFFLVVQDIRMTETAQLAHVVLPSTHFGEKEGTYTNRNGRVQKLNAATIAPEGAMQDCEVFVRLLDLRAKGILLHACWVSDALAKKCRLITNLGGDRRAGVQLGGGEAKQQ
jgi:predicted molibdopterin-dependent oxidoreductase YjgC